MPIPEDLFVEGANTFAVLDGASVAGLLDRLDRCRPEFVCLYRGELKPDLAEVAPYLVRLEAEGEFAEWIFSKAWGNHWGIFAVAAVDLQSMRQHFRRLLTVHDESGKPLLFRFYDPRVMRVYLPTCESKELTEVFGPVSRYILEGEGPGTCVGFGFAGGKVTVSSLKLNAGR